MPFVAGGAPATPPEGPSQIPAHPFLPPKKKIRKLFNFIHSGSFLAELRYVQRRNCDVVSCVHHELVSHFTRRPKARAAPATGSRPSFRGPSSREKGVGTGGPRLPRVEWAGAKKGYGRRPECKVRSNEKKRAY